MAASARGQWYGTLKLHTQIMNKELTRNWLSNPTSATQQQRAKHINCNNETTVSPTCPFTTKPYVEITPGDKQHSWWMSKKKERKSTTNSARKEDGCINTVVITGNIEEAQNNDGWRANGKLSKQSNECAPNSFTSSMIPQYQLDAPAHQSSTWTSHPDPWKREPRNPARILSYPYERHNTSMAQMVVLEFKYDG